MYLFKLIILIIITSFKLFNKLYSVSKIDQSNMKRILEFLNASNIRIFELNSYLDIQ